MDHPARQGEGFLQYLGSRVTFFCTSFLFAVVFGLFDVFADTPLPFFQSVPRCRPLSSSAGEKFLKPASQPSPPSPWPPGQWLIHR